MWGVNRRIQRLKTIYPINFDCVITAPINEPFSRAKGLDYGANFVCTNPNELMFFVDVDIFFNAQAVKTIRLLTIQGQTVYFPIVYSTFGNSHRNTTLRGMQKLENVEGYWRQFGYGMVAMYKSDYIGMDVKIRGWGKEDITLYDTFLRKKPHIELIRSSDPDIVHLYHPVKCDSHIPKDQLQMCLSSSYSNFRSTLDAALAIQRYGIVEW